MKNIGQMDVGPVRFALRGEGLACARYADWAYRGFVSPIAQDEARLPLAQLAVEVIPEARRAPGTPPLFSAGKNWAVWKTDQTLTFCAGFHKREKARWYCRVAPRMTGAELYVADDPSEAPLRYPIDQILSWGLLAQCGGFVLHAAAVEKNGRGLVLAGRSGVGKSTLAALCYEAGWTILNDDRVVVYPREGQWMVAGTPWHGSGRFARCVEVPIHGIYLLQQDEVDAIEPLTPRATRHALLDVASIPWFDDEWSAGSLDALERITAAALCRRCRFTRSRVAVQILETERAGP